MNAKLENIKAALAAATPEQIARHDRAEIKTEDGRVIPGVSVSGLFADGFTYRVAESNGNVQVRFAGLTNLESRGSDTIKARAVATLEDILADAGIHIGASLSYKTTAKVVQDDGTTKMQNFYIGYPSLWTPSEGVATMKAEASQLRNEVNASISEMKEQQNEFQNNLMTMFQTLLAQQNSGGETPKAEKTETKGTSIPK